MRHQANGRLHPSHNAWFGRDPKELDPNQRPMNVVLTLGAERGGQSGGVVVIPVLDRGAVVFGPEVQDVPMDEWLSGR